MPTNTDSEAKRSMEVFALHREEIKHLRRVNSDLLAACLAMLSTWGSDDEDAIIAARDQARTAVARATRQEIK